MLLVKILSMNPVIQFSPYGGPLDMVEVTYLLSIHGPFIIRIPKAEFYNVRVINEIDTFKTQVEALLART